MTTDNPITVAVTKLSAAIDALTTATSREARAADVAAKMKDFEPGERFHYAPQSEKDTVRKQITDAQLERAGLALVDLEDLVRDHEELLPGIIADVERPPTPLSAFMTRFGDNLKPGDVAIVELLHEARLTRCDRELGTAKPSQVLAVYERAIDDHDATTIGYVERLHGRGWAGPSAGSDESGTLEAQAALRLGRAIKEACEGRVGLELRGWEQALKKARTACQRARDLHSVEPKRKAS